MGEHKTNGLAQMKAAAQRTSTIDIGDNYRVAGVGLMPVIDAEGNLCIVLTVTGGRYSELLPAMQVAPVALVEIGKISLANLRADIANALKPAAEGLDG